MKYFVLPLLLMASFHSSGQDQVAEFDPERWEPPYKLIVPGGWEIERFQIPIEFAPSIDYQGIEDLRFTAGWGDPDSEEYWTYSFLWFLNGKEVFDANTFESNLQAYYTGLVGRNIEPRNIPMDKVFPVAATFEKVETSPGDAGTFKGTVHMLDYMQQKPITLNCLAHVRDCPGQDNTFVFYEISPQPDTHPIWKSLAGIWTRFDCSSN